MMMGQSPFAGGAGGQPVRGFEMESINQSYQGKMTPMYQK